MKEVVLITATWCRSCHAMLEWFHSIELPGITFKSMDAEDPALQGESISSVPVILFRAGGETAQTITGAMGRADLIQKINSFWPD